MTDADTVRQALDHLYHAGEAPAEWLTTGLAALDRLVAERDDYRAANEAVRVCAAHTRDIVDGDDCLVCSLGDALAERDRLRDALQRIASDGSPDDAAFARVALGGHQ